MSKNVDIFHEIDKKGYMSGCLSKPLTFFFLGTYLYFLMICSMDISNVKFLFFLISLTQYFSIPHWNQILLNFTKASYRLYCPKKRVAILKQNEKIIKIYVLDIPKYLFIILYSDNLKKLYAIFFWYLNDTEKWKKCHFFGLLTGGG